ncbi:MAG: Lrp/AsnC family transcriptional regulator [Chloroflexi bacterium]|nr:Lrp/AsnC family transcriptional regulator [Chloroflexota bacterium]
MKLDKLDQNIMMALQKNGRLSYMELAKMMAVTEGTIRNRFTKLVNNGIMRITASPDIEKLGYGFMGIIGMQVHLADLREVADKLAQNPNICYLVNVTGRYELLATVVTRSSKEFAYFMENVVSAIPNVLKTETFVALNVYKGAGSGMDMLQLIGNLDQFAPRKS